MSVTLTGHSRETLRLVVAISLSGSAVNFSLTDSLKRIQTNKQNKFMKDISLMNATQENNKELKMRNLKTKIICSIIFQSTEWKDKNNYMVYNFYNKQKKENNCVSIN